MTDAEFQVSPPGVCRRPYSRDVRPHPSGLAVSDTNSWFDLKHHPESSCVQLSTAFYTVVVAAVLTAPSGSLGLYMSGGRRILSISWKIPLTLTSSLYVTLAWLMNMLPWKHPVSK